MRVIAGMAKGRRLKGLPTRAHRGSSVGVRPSSDLTRGAIFSVLMSMEVDLTRVLDLYAGSGSLGIEALSRGGGWCDFVERNPALCSVIRENLRSTGFEDRSNVHPLPAERVAERLKGPYTLVLADPPYADAEAAAVMQSLAASQLVTPGETIFVLEHAAREEPSGAIGPFSIANTRRHGDSAISVYR